MISEHKTAPHRRGNSWGCKLDATDAIIDSARDTGVRDNLSTVQGRGLFVAAIQNWHALLDAFAIPRENSIHLARDPIGCNKLFFGRNPEGALVVADRAVQVWSRGVPLASIASCPQGHALAVSENGVRDLGGSDTTLHCDNIAEGGPSHDGRS